ncbi:CRAL-TRIO domain-containing protein C589.09 [Durusdinium trenchii]|uniref:Mitochondrial n=1 Tax=Durusdinium trenchii TaxID=1381693 RepID=A0ABP0SFZ0_9DINO
MGGGTKAQPRSGHRDVVEENKAASSEDLRDGVEQLRRELVAGNEIQRLSTAEADLSEATLRRFLRARDGNVAEAHKLVLEVLRWRAEHNVDRIVKRDYEFVAQDRWGMAYWHGRDVAGRPILVIRGCRHDPSLFETEATLRYLVWKLETKLKEPGVDDVVVIFDVLNITRHNLDMKLVRILIPLLLNYYPERLGVCLVYPTSQIMWILWKMVSRAFDDKTEKKFVFVREQKRDNKFLRLIAADQLQVRFGGSSNAEFGVDGLGLLPPDQLTAAGPTSSTSKEDHRSQASTEAQEKEEEEEEQQQQEVRLQATNDKEDEQLCLGPGAFVRMLDGDESDFDTEHAMRVHAGSLLDEDDEYKAFMEHREREVDRFQFKLRYQVSHYRMDPVMDEDSSEVTTSTQGTVHSAISDVAGGAEGGGRHIRTTASDAGSTGTRTRGRKRAKLKRFLRRHLLRRKSEYEHSMREGSGRGKRRLGNGANLSAAAVDYDSDMSFELVDESSDDGTHGGAQDRAGDDESSPFSSPDVHARLAAVREADRDAETGTPLSDGGSPRGFSRLASSGPSRRSRKRLSRSGTSVSESAHSLMAEVKFVMEAGASMRRVSRDDPSKETNSWSVCPASRFDTRIGPDYKKHKKKQPSAPAIYDCVCCDVWTLQSKRPHIASYMQLPDLYKSRPVSAKGEALAPIPELLIVNMMMPDYSPSGPFSKKRTDGPGQSVVMFSKLSDWAKDTPEDPAVQLWSRFVHVFKGDQFRERLKMITRLENPEDIALGRIERALLSKYNGTPWLVRPEYEFHKGPGYFEIDIDYHIFKYFVLSNALPLLDRVHNAILDCALIIQAEKDPEMPERVLVCTTIKNLNLREAPEIDLVMLDKSVSLRAKQRRISKTSFIDRDGQIHELSQVKTTEASVTVATTAASVAVSTAAKTVTSVSTVSSPPVEDTVGQDAADDQPKQREVLQKEQDVDHEPREEEDQALLRSRPLFTTCLASAALTVALLAILVALLRS